MSSPQHEQKCRLIKTIIRTGSANGLKGKMSATFPVKREKGEGVP